MTNCPEIGKIYDTIFFCIEYFNGDAVKRYITNNYVDTAFMTECYMKIKEKVSTLPPILAPIFFYRDQKPTAMTCFFDQQIDYKHDTIDTFIEKILENSDILCSLAIDSVFPDNQNLDNRTDMPIITQDAYIEALSDYEYSDSFKLQIALLFANFKRAVPILIEQLRNIYIFVDELHELYSYMLNKVAEQINSKINYELYVQLFKYDIRDKNDECFYTVSLLNQFIKKLLIHDIKNSLLLGYKHEKELRLQYDGQNINLYKLLPAIGNEIRFSIIEAFLENGELNSTAISKILDLPPTTALRHVETLYNCGVLYVSRRSGLRIFYRINYDVLEGVIDILNKKILESKEKTYEQTEND